MEFLLKKAKPPLFSGFNPALFQAQRLLVREIVAVPVASSVAGSANQLFLS